MSSLAVCRITKLQKGPVSLSQERICSLLTEPKTVFRELFCGYALKREGYTEFFRCSRETRHGGVQRPFKAA